MVTLATLIIGTMMFILIVVADMFVYKTTVMNALYLLFNVHISLGKWYLYIALIFLFFSAFIVDYRHFKLKQKEGKTREPNSH